MSTLTLEQVRGLTKICPHCGVAKYDSGYYVVKGRAGRSGLSSWCRTCTATASLKRRISRIADEAGPGATARVCRRCKGDKPLDAFSSRSWYCRACANDYQAERRAQDPKKARQDSLWTRFKITSREYEAMLIAQGGGCAICGNPPKSVRLHVDHDHACCPENGKSCGRCIRGLVCYPCNGKLSVLESDATYAVRLRAYLGVKVVRHQ